MKSTLFSGLRREVVKTRALRKEYDGLASPINYCRSLHKREIPRKDSSLLENCTLAFYVIFLFVKEQTDANFVVNTWRDS